MTNRLKVLATAALAAVGLMPAIAPARADDSPGPAYYEALRGKKVGFVPISMGFDLTQGWLAGMQRQAKELGYSIVVRDPNWSVESGIEAINSLIAEKPDVLIIQNNDNRSYNRLVRRALDSGIPTIQVQQRVQTASDAYIGPDWVDLGRRTAEGLVERCGAGTSGKVAIVQGATAAPASILMLQGIEETLKAHPEIHVVSSQAADWDATKAYGITSTVIKQNPDLCGVAGFWDVADAGTAGAIREAGLQGKVSLVTSGGGKRDAGCDKIGAGDFTVYTSYNVAGQARDLNSAIKVLLQAKLKAGSAPFALISPLTRITKQSMTSSSCWMLNEIEQAGG
jgi:ABC-type sugar transport system substrate-binding protein